MLMERRRKPLYGLALFSFLLVLFYFSPNEIDADSKEDEVVIDRYPDEAIFRLENMKPGDFAYRTLTVQNNQGRDLLYTMKLENAGEPKLYNELLLQVNFDSETVFNGKLKDYKGIKDRSLHTKSEEILEFYLKFPEELGNEYQGLRADFIIDFTAKAGDDTGIVAGVVTENGNPIKGMNGSGGKLPITATNIFTYLLIGIFLIIAGGIASRLTGRKNEALK